MKRREPLNYRFSWRRLIFFLIGLLGILIFWIQAPALITPPIDPPQPVTAYVNDQGLHAELVLPQQNGQLVQYAYGDWRYFALHQHDLASTLAALFLPTPGALGRRTYRSVEELQQTVNRSQGQLLSVVVSQARVDELLSRLNDRFQSQMATQVENSQIGLTLVQDKQSYIFFRNSNHVVVEWLQELGCRVEGFVLQANFKVKAPPSF